MPNHNRNSVVTMGTRKTEHITDTLSAQPYVPIAINHLQSSHCAPNLFISSAVSLLMEIDYSSM